MSFHLYLSSFFQGGANGLLYGLLAVGLVLVYRSSRFINFAHAQVGAFGSAILALLVVKGGVPFWVALPMGLAVGAALSGLLELLVVRRLSRAPRIMSMVATLGVGQVLFVFAVLLNTATGDLFPEPTGIPLVTVSGFIAKPAYLFAYIAGPVTVLALVAFFRWSRYGLAIRASAANPDAAAMAAMSPRRLTTLVWAIAGAVAALTTTILIPILGAAGGSTLGPSFLVRALAAGVIARMRSLTVSMVVGIGIGVIEGILNANQQYEILGKQPFSPGFVDVLLFLAIAVALLLQGRPGRREDEKGQWLAVQAWAPLPEQLRQVWAIRRLPWITAVVGFAALAAIVPLLDFGKRYSYASLIALAIVGLSLTLVTSSLGQLSLGQFGIAAAGAYTCLEVGDGLHSWELGILAAVVVGIGVSISVGIPALRVQGLLLAVATLAFSLCAASWIFKDDAISPFAFGDIAPTDVELLGVRIADTRDLCFVALVGLAVALFVAASVRTSSLGRLFISLRDNEDAARAFGVRATVRKLQAYAIAGAIAGLGGAIFSIIQITPTADLYKADVSITVVALAVVGGLSSVAGPILGAVIALPLVSNIDNGLKATILCGWIALILFVPTGIAGVIKPVRDLLIDALARLGGVDPVAARAGADPAQAANITASRGLEVLELDPAGAGLPAAGEPLLQVTGVVKRYGGLTAVGGVDLEVCREEIVGLIGANGAGKTTLFEVLSGFVRPDEGTIHLAGTDITRWTPERRARAGLIRSFQDSALFPTLTVLETVLLSNERRHPSRVGTAVLGLPGSEAKRLGRARELVSLVGLDRYRHTQIGSLSTGTRRIAELACMINLEPTLLLLDEPSSGIAQGEVEALGTVLQRICRQLRATMVIIEHDIPLVSSIADRMVAMETGTVLSVGTPAEVLNDPRVISSYLGGDPASVSRSRQGPASKPRKAAPTKPARRTTVKV